MQFTYYAHLYGNVMHNYAKQVDGHYIWFFSLPDVLYYNNMTNQKTISQIIDVDTYGKYEMQLVIEPPLKSKTLTVGKRL